MDASCLALAAKYIRRQANQLAAQLDGVCAGTDVEFVHRARVASRRLRAALRMFRDCFAAKRAKRWRKRLRRVTSELGGARDKDVQIELICGTLHAVSQPGCYPGIARLLVHLERDRELQQPKVVKAVRRLRRSQVLDQMQAASKDILSQRTSEERSLERDTVRSKTAEHIRRRLEEMLCYQDSLRDPRAEHEHHLLRIATKRLRYTLEIANAVYDKQLDLFIEAAKKVQSLLGEVHDCDVWLVQLDAFAAAERKSIVAHFGNDGPFARLEVGIEYLRHDRRAHRDAMFRELVECWEDLKRQEHWDNLLRVIAAPPQPAGALPAPATAAVDDVASPGAVVRQVAAPAAIVDEVAMPAQSSGILDVHGLGESRAAPPRPHVEPFDDSRHHPYGAPQGMVRRALQG